MFVFLVQFCGAVFLLSMVQVVNYKEKDAKTSLFVSTCSQI